MENEYQHEHRIMKDLLRFISLVGMALLLLSACAPAATAPQPRSAAPNVVGGEDSMYPPQDLSLVANTGRPQFIHSYADWCTTCKTNHPLVNELQADFSDQIDFVNLNIDVPETLDLRTRFDLVDRSRYIFIDTQGNVVQRWFGLLDQATVESYLRDYLAAV
jgi:thiol:disulfide interchange protein